MPGEIATTLLVMSQRRPFKLGIVEANNRASYRVHAPLDHISMTSLHQTYPHRLPPQAGAYIRVTTGVSLHRRTLHDLFFRSAASTSISWRLAWQNATLWRCWRHHRSWVGGDRSTPGGEGLECCRKEQQFHHRLQRQPDQITAA